MPQPYAYLLESRAEPFLAFAQPRLGLAEAQHRFDARYQDVPILRPVNIAVRAVIQFPRYGVAVHASVEQEEHGQMRRPWLLPDLRAELMSVHAGHGNVQQDQVGKSLCDFPEDIGGPFSLGDGKARPRQGATDGIANRGVVADIENAAGISDWIHNMTSF